jgi:hypothetical protein
MMLTVVSGARFVEVPVNYLPRVGVSSVTGHWIPAIGVGLRMIQLVLRFRRSTPRRLVRAPAFVHARSGPRDEANDQLQL